MIYLLPILYKSSSSIILNLYPKWFILHKFIKINALGLFCLIGHLQNIINFEGPQFSSIIALIYLLFDKFPATANLYMLQVQQNIQVIIKASFKLASMPWLIFAALKIGLEFVLEWFYLCLLIKCLDFKRFNYTFKQCVFLRKGIV